MLFFLAIALYLQISQTGDIIQDQVKIYGTSMANALADFCIEDLLSYNYPALQLSVNYIGRQDSQILGIKIYHENRVVADYTSNLVKDEKRGDPATCDKCGDVFVSPVIFKPIDQEERLLGEVKFYLSDEKYREFLTTQTNLIWILGLILLFGDIFASIWIIRMLILNPLKKVSEGAKIMGEGNLDYKIEVPSKDEIGALAMTLNNMSEKLKTNKEKMSKQTLSLKKFQETLVKTLDETEEAKRKIEEEQSKISAIVSNLVDPVVVIDRGSKIILANPSAKSVLGIKEGDVVKNDGLCDSDGCAPRKLCLCEFKKIIKTAFVSKVLKSDSRKYPIVEEMILGKDEMDKDKNVIGESKVFKVLTSQVSDEEGNIFGYMKIFYDLTKEKIVDEMKSEFISIAAHQLRTPSSGVKWALEMILGGEMGKVPRQASEYIKKAYDANEQMVELVRDLLNVSHIEKGKFAYKFSRVDFEKMLSDIIDASKITASQNNIKIIFLKTKNKISQVAVDFEKMKLAIQNLINNSIKYSKPGKRVVVELDYGTKDEKFIYITVRDKGIGISKKDQKSLFSKFYRGDNAKKLQTEGSGLGLFIAKKVIEVHGGKISLDSEIGKGSVFYVKIPIKK